MTPLDRALSRIGVVAPKPPPRPPQPPAWMPTRPGDEPPF
jgi:hypothetical protein